jgi:NAD(P)-dependent dehydrogenase (short-subunit alcohol dehydrogenase family)
MSTTQIALITGVGKETGIGFETARQLGRLGYQVIITARKQETAGHLAAMLINEQLDTVPLALDVTDETMVKAAAEQIDHRFGRLDVLINNATLFPDKFDTVNVDLADIKKVFDTNFIGAWSTIKYFTPLLKKSDHARIVNVSSGSGSYAGEEFSLLNPWRGVISAYSISKLALNGLTLKAALDLKNDNILVNAATPGITASYEILAKSGGRPVSEGAQSIVLAATLPKGGATGQFFKDGKVIGW